MVWVALAAGLAAAAEPAWTLDLDASPWPFLSDAGVLLLATDTEVLGVDVADGSVRWRRPQPESVRGDLFQPVPFTDDVLLSTLVAGPDTFEVVDARTGVTRWTAPLGEVVLGVWPAPDATRAVVLTARAEDPGWFALEGVPLADGAPSWRIEDALRAPPPIVPARPGRTAAYTARATVGPVFDGDAVVTLWSPSDGLARRGPDGDVVWRAFFPGAERLLPSDGFAEPIVVDGTLLVPVRADRVAAFDAATGASRWRPAAGHVRGVVGHLAAAGDRVVVAGLDEIDGLGARDGKPAWRTRLGVPVDDLVAVGDVFAAVDADGVVHGFAHDGTVRFATTVAEEAGAIDLDVVDGALVARFARGAASIDPATGAVSWRREGEGSLPEESPWDRVAGGGQAAGLFREIPPADDPARAEHVWVIVERVDGRSMAVLHRTDLRTGEDRAVPLGSQNPRWMWDARTGTALVLHREGRIEAFRP